jgi:hypothetical protein
MSLSIDVDKVTGVLLPDGWHDVADNSFDVDAYEFVHHGETIHRGGEGGVTSEGFRFKDGGGQRFYGPLTTLQAIRIG